MLLVALFLSQRQGRESRPYKLPSSLETRLLAGFPGRWAAPIP